MARTCVCGNATRARCAECAVGVRARKSELAVRDVLAAHEATAGFAWNARARGTAYRPDFLWVFPDACVLLEVDENAHRAYDPAAERAREDTIRAALGRPVRVVRLLLPRAITADAVARAAERLIPTLACRIAEAQEYGARKKTRA
jgi:hypothetical protein